MFLTQLEYREKTTATNWRRMQFTKQMNFQSEDTALPNKLLQTIASIAAFGTNQPNHAFANGIARIIFQAAHEQYMWFCKSTLQEDTLRIDEEELYDNGDTLLMRRAFEEFTLADTEAGQIDVSISMLAQHPELTVLQTLQQSLQRVHYFLPNDHNKSDLFAQIRTAPHGTLILLDGSACTTPLDVSEFAERNDLQLLTVNFNGIPNYTLVRKGKNIALQEA